MSDFNCDFQRKTTALATIPEDVVNYYTSSSKTQKKKSSQFDIEEIKQIKRNYIFRTEGQPVLLGSSITYIQGHQKRRKDLSRQIIALGYLRIIIRCIMKRSKESQNTKIAISSISQEIKIIMNCHHSTSIAKQTFYHIIPIMRQQLLDSQYKWMGR